VRSRNRHSLFLLASAFLDTLFGQALPTTSHSFFGSVYVCFVVLCLLFYIYKESTIDKSLAMLRPASFLALLAAFKGVTAIYDLPYPPEARRDVLGPFDIDESSLLKRSTHDASFPLNFNAVNQVLFTGYVMSRYVVFCN